MKRADVPCDGCTACCKHDIIFLHPENGDKPETYETIEVFNPISKRVAPALARAENGWCIYLGPGGCTIHDRAPVICQKFDCRKFVQMLGNRADRRRAAVGNEVVRAGVERLKTL